MFVIWACVFPPVPVLTARFSANSKLNFPAGINNVSLILSFLSPALKSYLAAFSFHSILCFSFRRRSEPLSKQARVLSIPAQWVFVCMCVCVWLFFCLGFVFLLFADSLPLLSAPNSRLTCTARLWSSSSAGWGSWACPPSPPPSRSPRRSRTGRWSCGDARRTACLSRGRRAERSCTPQARAPGSAAGLCGISGGCSCCRRRSLAWCRPPRTPSAGSHISRTGRSPEPPSDTGSGRPQPRRKLGGSGEPILKVLLHFYPLLFSPVLRMLSLHHRLPNNNVSMLCIHYIHCRTDNKATLNLEFKSSGSWDGRGGRHVGRRTYLPWWRPCATSQCSSPESTWALRTGTLRTRRKLKSQERFQHTAGIPVFPLWTSSHVVCAFHSSNFSSKYLPSASPIIHTYSTFVRDADQQKTLLMFPWTETLSCAPSWITTVTHACRAGTRLTKCHLHSTFG